MKSHRPSIDRFGRRLRHHSSRCLDAPSARAGGMAIAGAIMALSSVPACSSTTPEPLNIDGGATPQASLTPSSACNDAIERIYGDPGPLDPDPSKRGDIVACATDPDLSKEALQARLAELGYTGAGLTSGARVVRIAYRTERGDAASTPSVSSAIVYLPDTPRAEKLPIVVAGRGSRGQAASCAVSKFDPSQPFINGDAHRLVYPLVGQGYAVILSDLAGYANFGAPKNPPSGYAHAADVARSTLDSGRALKKLVPALDDKVVLVGHSQGGHSTLASLALADSYGTAAPIVGAAVYAPLWFSQRTWGAALAQSVNRLFPIDESSVPAVSVWYHYTQAELLDGPGEGKKLFAAAKADQLEDYVKTTCWEQKADKLLPLGKYADEYFDPAFVASVSKPALGTLGPCRADDAVCEKWIQRYLADRPKLAGKAAEIPLLVLYGGSDTTIPPGRMRCGVDRLMGESKKLTVCVEPAQTHGGIVTAKADYVGDWIASVAMGAPAPAACAAGEAAIAVQCDTPPPND